MAILDLLSEVAAEAPLVIILDDAHWLDRASPDVWLSSPGASSPTESSCWQPPAMDTVTA
jgi:hypothetical protein